jgi:O-antigen/teichoic acid export membrane protein
MKLRGRIGNLILGAVDGLSYPVALVAAGPTIIRLSGTADYSKFAFIIVLSAAGTLFNFVGAQGVIYTLARSDVSSDRRSAILSATLLITLIGMLLFAAALVFVLQYTGAEHIFLPQEVVRAALLGWALCLLVCLDSVFAGVLKARSLIALSASVEFVKLLGLMAALTLVAGRKSWQIDCMCFVTVVFFSTAAKALLVSQVAKVHLAGRRAALAEFGEVARVNGWQWLMLLSSFLFQQADRLIIAPRMGAERFAVYNFCWQISSVVHSASAASLISILPATTARLSANPGGNWWRAFLQDVKFGVLFSTVLVAGALTFGTIAFKSGILPGALQNGLSTFLIMVSCVYLAALAIVPYYYLVALGQMRVLAGITAAAAALSFVMALSIVGTFGVNGLALSKTWGAVTLSCYWLCYRKMRRPEHKEAPTVP